MYLTGLNQTGESVVSQPCSVTDAHSDSVNYEKLKRGKEQIVPFSLESITQLWHGGIIFIKPLPKRAVVHSSLNIIYKLAGSLQESGEIEFSRD